jgi:L-alanine-DL-glutamate epimerase-like enolase superfamily enzyme
MKISDVVLFRVNGHYTGSGYPYYDRSSGWLDIYPEFNVSPRPRPAVTPPEPISHVFVEVRSDEGVTGLYGPIQDRQAFIIQKTLRPFLVGRDPLATELLSDQMQRLERSGLSGDHMAAVGPVDCALWDLKGKAWNQPVYRILGGPTRASMPAYAGLYGFYKDAEYVAQVAREMKAKGFTAQKWYFRYGPADGEEGRRKNLEQARAIREAVGEHYMLMFDVWMSWEAPYAIDMLKALAPLNPAWFEEPVPPRVGALKQIREATGVPIASGEHVHTRWQVKELLTAGAVDFIQTNSNWAGGITEQMKICALCSAFDVPVMQMGHSVIPELHVGAAQSPVVVPLLEIRTHGQVWHQHFFKPNYFPENGQVRLPDLPGLGLVLDEDKIESREPLEFRA